MPRAPATPPPARPVQPATQPPSPAAPPWWVPVPVRPSRFVPLHARHRAFNLEVALERVGAYALAPRAMAPGALAHCDLQTNLDDNAPRRLGAGRAAHYAGRYVKGIGRTPLAANWNDPDDSYHASGYLAPSGGLREYLISQALRARGVEHTVVPCEGVLLRALPASEGARLARRNRAALPAASAADASMLCLTVKPGDFARMSNFVWALNHLPARLPALGELFLALERHARPPGARHAASEGTPEDIVAALFDAASRALEHVDTYVNHGVYWLSFHNNFTLDGRFVDLETPVFLGAPALALVRARARPGRAAPGRAHWMGLEAFRVARQWRLFLRHLALRARFLADEVFTGDAPARAFLRALVAALRDRTREDHPVLSDAALEARVLRTLARALDPSTRERALLAGVVHAERVREVQGRPARDPDLALRPAAFAIAEPAPTDLAECLVPDFVAARLAGRTGAGECFRDALGELGALTDRDALLARLPALARALTHAAGSAAPRAESGKNPAVRGGVIA